MSAWLEKTLALDKQTRMEFILTEGQLIGQSEVGISKHFLRSREEELVLAKLSSWRVKAGELRRAAAQCAPPVPPVPKWDKIGQARNGQKWDKIETHLHLIYTWGEKCEISCEFYFMNSYVYFEYLCALWLDTLHFYANEFFRETQHLDLIYYTLFRIILVSNSTLTVVFWVRKKNLKYVKIGRRSDLSSCNGKN